MSQDPLLLHSPLPFRVELPVLGIPVRFTTNDREILDHIENVFGHWRGVEVDPLAAAGADMKLLLHDGDEGSAVDTPVTYRCPDPMRWMVHTPGSFGIADLERQSGTAYVTRQLVRDPTRFRVTILQFVVLITITVKDRTPVHAAMIGRGDAALLLAGPAGSGKSTLAYAASKAGFDVLSDDAAYVQLEPRRVWGGGSSLLLLGDTARRFPEVAAEPTTLFPTGKRKMIVTAPTRATPWVTRVGVCALERSNGPVRVSGVDDAAIREMLTHDPSGSAVRYGPRLDEAARWLTRSGAWQLTLSSDPSEAIPFLAQLIEEL